MQILLDFLRRYNYIFLFVVLEIVSLTLLFRFNDYQGSVWLTAAGEGAAQLNRAYTETESFFNLRDINGALTDDNLRLQRENASLRDALAEALHDSTHTERRVLQELGGYRLLPARVVSNNVRSGGDGYLVLDRGSADGIRPEMGVVGGGGVVGIIYLVGPRHSLVLPVTNSKSSISCCVRGSHYFGYLLWDGGSTRKAHVDDVPRYAKVRAGNVIETSGYSSVFPPGIFVGRVHRVSNSSDGQSYRLDVVLGTDFGNIRDVNVVITPYKAEIDSLRAKADSLKSPPPPPHPPNTPSPWGGFFVSLSRCLPPPRAKFAHTPQVQDNTHPTPSAISPSTGAPSGKRQETAAGEQPFVPAEHK